MNQTLPARTVDVWRLATAEEKREWIGKLAALRPRPDADPKADAEALDLVLTGVTFYGLSEAVTRILNGCLGNDFQPTATRLKLVIREVMKPHVWERELREMSLLHPAEPPKPLPPPVICDADEWRRRGSVPLGSKRSAS